jgi:glutamate--cysteine ligase
VPGPHRQLTLRKARDHILEHCFAPDGPALVGLEAEWLSVAVADPAAPVPFDSLQEAVDGAGPLPAGSAVTWEPGGQLELSTPPAADVGGACASLAADMAAVRPLAQDAGVDLAAIGIDPRRPPQRVVDTPRYEAMETFFAADGDEGRRMMCSTAALQVNVGASHRWEVAHAVGPALAAAFSNSPVVDGRPTGSKSTRLATWWAIDPTRTAPARTDWADYALAARVMLMRDDSSFVPVCTPLPFAAWVEDGHELGHPTVDDLDYHLTTLFPPVRAKSWLEVRYLDAVPDPWWRAAATVVSAVLVDDEAAERARRASAGTENLWSEASRFGLEHEDLARAAGGCFDAALDAGPRVGADTASLDVTAEYADRFVARGRTPADDLLDRWEKTWNWG